VSTALAGLTISVADGVQTLVDSSLVQYAISSEGSPRLSFLEMIRQYAQLRLAESGELDQARDAHADYYLALAEEAESDTPATVQHVWQNGLEREEGNLRAALQWLIERNRMREAQRLSRLLRDMQSETVTPLYQDTTSPDRNEERIVPSVLTSKSTESFTYLEYEELTARETEVLRLLALGLSNKQIAARLIISPHTVNGHIHSIFGKLALNSRSAATRYAVEHHIA
ncbi:MAG TPA: LuxR C-terminal-related transcriptional regulator, partial [Ktedonobacteraceae bacterium]|nr:LuxR C-terminal-related transcriptional regulator [Ktedonobacteraceae bacterium]